MHTSKHGQAKILSRDELRRRVEQWREAGERVTLANGNFDLLHVGHVRYLREAKALGGKLVVAINSDESVRALKGEDRPIMPENERAEIVAALADVDAVVIFPELDVRAIIRAIRPDIQAKGTDYTVDSVPERDTVAECGGRVAIVGDPKDHSSSEIIGSRLASLGQSKSAQSRLDQPRSSRPKSGQPRSGQSRKS
jgi:D-glycero-beta-D-manno-heptose 1-phosphate adenylyltransferase